MLQTLSTFTMTAVSTPLFPLGTVQITDAAAEELGLYQALALLQQHANGNWDGMCPENIRTNGRALEAGWRIVSDYQSLGGRSIQVITWEDRSQTVILLPREWDQVCQAIAA